MSPPGPRYSEGRPPAGPARTAESPNSTASTVKISDIPRHHHHEPLTVEDGLDTAVLAAAAERGYRLAARCIRCSQWFVAPASVARYLGLVCAGKAEVAA